MSVDFSIVIPTFRRRTQLVEAIGSALSQTGISLEVIVVDDSPEASAREVVNEFDGTRVQYLSNPLPSGGVPSAVRNLGWPRAQGTFIHFLDDDDIVPEGHYAAVKAAFSEHPEVGVVFGRIDPFGDAPGEQMRHEHQFFDDAARRALLCRRFGPKWGFAGCMMFRRTLLVCGAGVVRRECVQRVGGFDPRSRIGEDVDFYARAIRQCGAYFMDRVTLRYRIGSPSLMHSPALGESEAQELREARRRTHVRYRAQWGSIEFFAMKIFAHTVL